MAFAHDGFVFKPSSLFYEELYNWCCMPVQENQVIVNLSSDFDRKPLEDELESQIEKLWEKRVKDLPLLYNASKFRLQSVELTKNRLILNVGMTCYRDFICTNMRNDIMRERIRQHSLDKYGDPHSCFADPVGVDGLVISSDDKVILLRRSQQVYEAPGMFHIPGGHPEPSEVKGNNEGKLKLEDMDPKDVVHEMFYSIVKEVRDEVNVPIGSLSWPVLIGIQRNQESSGRPEACFLIRCSLSSEEIKKCYAKGGPEAYESTEILTIGMSEFREWNPTNQMTKLLEEITPSTKATLHFYLQKNNCSHETKHQATNSTGGFEESINCVATLNIKGGLGFSRGGECQGIRP
ncbi:uridine diphosphate glucose pyrophosphatase NUDT22-like [Actinia tenebrosa]|uniref:Uridine diphosphate glucose pyrophosphatase NUDT22-like n=1 Tax=Actinia tenebrosa TaxID=6105 RepID=A0A6P8IH91_ACTTE|nr:uridine diphosphate glucose pyrophosphatase NUDT22-like [Actinia tenebrosa]